MSAFRSLFRPVLLIVALLPAWAADRGALDLHLQVDPQATVRTYRQMSEARIAFYRKNLIDGYRDHGVHDPRWDQRMQEYLEVFSADLGRDPYGIGNNPDRRQKGEAIAADGCTDPVVLYLISTDRNGFADKAAGRAAAAGIYPAMRTQGYPGYLRFRVMRKLAFTPGRLDAAARAALLADPGRELTAWLADPLVLADPWIVSEQLEPTDFQDPDPAVNRTFWTTLAACPDAQDPAGRWLVKLVRGIAHVYLSGALDDERYAVRTALGPADAEEVGKALADLREARRLNPRDPQAACWIFRLAASASVTSDVSIPRAFTEAVAGDPSSHMLLGPYRRWLARTGDDPAATAQLIVELGGLGRDHDSLFQWTTYVLRDYLQKHPDQAAALLADPRLPGVLSRYHWTLVDDEDHGRPAGSYTEYAAALWRMGRLIDARAMAAKQPRDLLGRQLGSWGGSLERFDQAIADDPRIKAFDAALGLMKTGPTEGIEALREVAKSGQEAALGALAFNLANHGGLPEAITLAASISATFDVPGDPVYEACYRVQDEADRGALTALARRPAWLLESRWSTWLFNQVRSHGRQSELAPLLDPEWRHRPAYIIFWGAPVLAEAGRFTEALDWFETAVKEGRPNDNSRGTALAWCALCARMAREPDRQPSAEALTREIGKGHYMPAIDPLLRYLSKAATRDEALAQAGDNADELRYYLAIDAMGRGDAAQAGTDLQAVIDRHPGWIEAGGAKALLAWMRAHPLAPGAPANF